MLNILSLVFAVHFYNGRTTPFFNVLVHWFYGGIGYLIFAGAISAFLLVLKILHHLTREENEDGKMWANNGGSAGTFFVGIFRFITALNVIGVFICN